jgi:hypothetical protein
VEELIGRGGFSWEELRVSELGAKGERDVELGEFSEMSVYVAERGWLVGRGVGKRLGSFDLNWE